jgi:hypothetical protein
VCKLGVRVKLLSVTLVQPQNLEIFGWVFLRRSGIRFDPSLRNKKPCKLLEVLWWNHMVI